VNSYWNTTICIVIGGVAKMLFYPNVEEFSLMQIVQGANLTLFDHPLMWFQAEYSGIASSVKHRRPQAPADTGFSVPFWTLVISLNNGRVAALNWDDGCIGCSGDQCVDDTCAIDITRCLGYNGDTTTGADCSPKFFVGWFGTDRDGVYLTSAGSRYSRFRSYSVASAFNNAYDTTSLDLGSTVDTYTTFNPPCSDDSAQCCSGPDC